MGCELQRESWILSLLVRNISSSTSRVVRTLGTGSWIKSCITSHTAAASLSVTAGLCWLSPEYLKSFFLLFFFSFSFLAICKPRKNKNGWMTFYLSIRSQSKYFSSTYNFSRAKLFPIFNQILHFLISFILLFLPKVILLALSFIKSHQWPPFVEIYAYPLVSYTYAFLKCFPYTTVMEFFTHNFALLIVVILKTCLQNLWYYLSQNVRLISAPLEWRRLDLLTLF